MSLYADYLKERTGDLIVETDVGFATYRFINDGRSVYIVDIYTDPRARKLGAAAAMADTIVESAKARGCVELIGTVVPSAKGATASLAALLAYGMTLLRAADDLIVFRKDI